MDLGNTTGIFPSAGWRKLGCLAVGVLLAGCSHAVRKQAPPPPGSQAILTGIPACDAYLSSYLACHRAAGIFSPGALSSHYLAMRDSLVKDANDPHVRPYLANRCMGLTQQLSASLHGRTCTPQTTASQPASQSASPIRTQR